MSSIAKKVVIVGDGGCGKTCLCAAFSKHEFPEDYIPTIYDSYTKTVQLDGGEEVEMTMWDTAGEEEFDRLRPLSYPRTDVIIVCFSIDNPDSLTNVIERWARELRYFCPKVPLILVGTKLDLRNNPEVVQNLSELHLHPVKFKEGLGVAKSIKAVTYIESSALTLVGVRDVFIKAAEISVNPPKKRRFLCWTCL